MTSGKVRVHGIQEGGDLATEPPVPERLTLMVARVFLGVSRRVGKDRPGVGGQAGLRTGAPNPRQRGKQTRGQCSGSYLNES